MESKEGIPGIFTQSYREGHRYHTECSTPNGIGNLIHQYAEADGQGLSVAMAHLVMSSYITTGGRLPADWHGPTPTTLQY